MTKCQRENVNKDKGSWDIKFAFKKENIKFRYCIFELHVIIFQNAHFIVKNSADRISPFI